MLTIHYKIADIPLELEVSPIHIPSRLQDFASTASADALHYKIRYADYSPAPGLQKTGKVGGRTIRRTDTGWLLYAPAADALPYAIETDETWQNCTLYVTEQSLKVIPETYRDQPEVWIRRSIFQALKELFQVSVITNQRIYLHAVLMRYNQSGIAFTAPAGIGKSTHAALWQTCFPDRTAVINGDNCVLRPAISNTLAYGLPWSGSSADHLNETIPLNAIVLIERAPRNQVTRLTQDAALSELMRRCFLPLWDQLLLLQGLDTLGQLLTHTPVYRLQCLPDIDSVHQLKTRLTDDAVLPSE